MRRTSPGMNQREDPISKRPRYNLQTRRTMANQESLDGVYCFKVETPISF